MKHKIIGTTEYIYLPDASTEPVPAKVDTGADGAAIWASSISEVEGVLSYVLFAPESSLYTGETFSTDEYFLVSVKNSFGEKELRYRVKLRMKIGGKTYRIKFTLADRSRNRFPVLLGKRFLRERFVVDVSKHNVSGARKDTSLEDKVVVLTSRIDSETKDFFKKVEVLSGSAVEVYKYRKLDYEIGNNGVTRVLLEDGRDIARASMVYFKAHALYPEHALSIARYLQYRHVPFIDPDVAGAVSRSKFSELFILSLADVPVPATKVLSNGAEEYSYQELADFFGQKTLVIKDAFGDRGKNNFIVDDEQSYREATERLEGSRTIVGQRYVSNDGFLRVLLVGDEVAQVVHRHTAQSSDRLKRHLDKPRGSSNARNIDPSEIDSGALALARRAALALDRAIVGVDLVQDKETNEWYVLEANYNPELVGGYDTKQKAKALADLIKRRK